MVHVKEVSALPLIASKFSLTPTNSSPESPSRGSCPKHRTCNPNNAARRLLARFSPKGSRSKLSRTALSACRKINSSGSGGVPDLNRSVERVDGDLNSSHEREREQVASRPPKPRTVRAYRARQHRDTLDSRQKDRHLGTAIHNSSNSNSSATKSERHTARSDIQGAQAEGGAERHQASARAPPRRCPPSCTHTMRPSDARSAAAPPRAPPYGRGKARRRRTGAPAGARRHAAAAALARALP